jgi:adrenodoxin-NADP+ reductase
LENKNIEFQIKGGKLTSEDQEIEVTDETETIECGLVLRSIGYKSVPVESGIPYDDKKGIIPNVEGRVTGEDGLYCAGWLATGPRGVIVDTMNEAFNVSQGIINDWKAGQSSANAGQKSGFVEVEKLFLERGIRPVSFENWEEIDKKEKEMGEVAGKPREKFIDIKTMVSVLMGTQS